MATVEVDEAILIWAQRYAIGRQTYAPHDVIAAIYDNLDRLSLGTSAALIREINEREGAGPLGSPTIDAPEWIRLRDVLAQHRVTQ